MAYTHATAQDWYDGNMAKFQQMGRAAVGCEMTVVLEKKGNMARKFKGEIIEATPCGFRQRARSVVVRFSVTLKNERGTKTVTLEKLPRY
jgi:hypothetical protein